MCNAWLLLTRQAPDGARAHTGYAYGPLRAAERLLPKGSPPSSTIALHHPQGLVLQPPKARSAVAGPTNLAPQQYAHEASAHGVKQPTGRGTSTHHQLTQ